MLYIHASFKSAIDAPPQAVYALIADYRHGHPQILPPQYFSNLEVEQGGTGEGTVIRFNMHTPGAKRNLRAEITEPEPGRVLVETYPETSGVTTFTVDPIGKGKCSVTITTEYTQKGLTGWVERLFVPPFLRRVFRAELQQLNEVATAQK